MIIAGNGRPRTLKNPMEPTPVQPGVDLSLARGPAHPFPMRDFILELSPKTVPRTGANRFLQARISRHRRLAPIADLRVCDSSKNDKSPAIISGLIHQALTESGSTDSVPVHPGPSTLNPQPVCPIPNLMILSFSAFGPRISFGLRNSDLRISPRPLTSDP